MESKTMMIAIGVCAVLLVAGVGAYFFLQEDETDLKVAYLDKGGYEALLVAQSKGYFNDINCNVELSPNTGSGQNCVERLLAGDVDIAATGDGPLINALVSADYKDIVKVVCSIGYTMNSHTFVARAGSGIVNPDTFAGTEAEYKAQLKTDLMSSGKKIGIIAGSTTESTFEKWCKSYLGMTDAEYTTFKGSNLSYITNGDNLVMALQANTIDAMAASNPYPVAALGIDGTYKIGSSDDIGVKGTMVLVTTQAIYDEKADAMKKFVKAMKNATDFMSDSANIDECVDICLKKINWGLANADNNKKAQKDALINAAFFTAYDDVVIDMISANGASKGLAKATVAAACPLKDYLAEINA